MDLLGSIVDGAESPTGCVRRTVEASLEYASSSFIQMVEKDMATYPAWLRARKADYMHECQNIMDDLYVL